MEIPTPLHGRCLSRALVPAAGEETPAAYPEDAALVRDKDPERDLVPADLVPEQGEEMEARAPAMADPGRESRAGA